MFELPSTIQHYQRLQAEFNHRLFSVYDDAKEIVKQRAEQYDTQRPVWERVSFPHGFMHEVSKKLGRVKAQIDDGERCMVPKAWAHTREDILDAANYLLFMAVYGDMLHDEMFAVDIPTQAAAALYDVPLDEVTKEQRAAAKAVTFAALYGQGVDDEKGQPTQEEGGKVPTTIEELRHKPENKLLAILDDEDEEWAKQLAEQGDERAIKALADLEAARLRWAAKDAENAKEGE